MRCSLFSICLVLLGVAVDVQAQRATCFEQKIIEAPKFEQRLRLQETREKAKFDKPAVEVSEMYKLELEKPQFERPSFEKSSFEQCSGRATSAQSFTSLRFVNVTAGLPREGKRSNARLATTRIRAGTLQPSSGCACPVTAAPRNSMGSGTAIVSK